MKICLPNYILYNIPFLNSTLEDVFVELKKSLDNLKDDSFNTENSIGFELYKLSDLKEIFSYITSNLDEINLIKTQNKGKLLSEVTKRKNVVIQFYNEDLFDKFKLMLCFIISAETINDHFSRNIFSLNNFKIKINDSILERSTDLEISIKERYLNNVKLFLCLSEMSSIEYNVFASEKINKKFKEFSTTMNKNYLFGRKVKFRRFWKNNLKNEEIIYEYLSKKGIENPSYDVIEDVLKNNDKFKRFKKILELLEMEQFHWFSNLETVFNNNGEYSKNIQEINEWINGGLEIVTIDYNDLSVHKLENISPFNDLDSICQNKIKLITKKGTCDENEILINYQTKQVVSSEKTRYVFNEKEKREFLNIMIEKAKLLQE